MSEAPPSIRAILAQFAQFLRQPRLLTPSGLRAPGAWKVWLVMTACSILVLVGIILPFLRLWQALFDLPDPAAFQRFPKELLVPFVVIVAPLLEELLFRGWHSGTRRALWLLAAGLAAIGGVVWLGLPGRETAGMVVLVGALTAGVFGAVVLRRHTAPLGWFARAFPAIFYLAAALFALVHLGNYDKAGLIAVPLVVPQLWAGLVLGYLRQKIGLPGAIAAHAASNLLVVGLAMLTSPA